MIEEDLMQVLYQAGYDIYDFSTLRDLASILENVANAKENCDEIENQMYDIGLLMEEVKEGSDRFQELEKELTELQEELESL